MRKKLSRRQALKSLSAAGITGIGMVTLGSGENTMVQAHTMPKEAAYPTVYAPGKPAVAPSVRLHGEVASFSPELLTIKIGREHIEVNIKKTQMWRMNDGRAWEAKRGEKVTITGDYIANGSLNARHIWLGLDNLFA